MNKIASYIPVNWGLISNPLNWVTILLMVIIGGFAAQQVVRLVQQKGTTANG